MKKFTFCPNCGEKLVFPEKTNNNFKYNRTIYSKCKTFTFDIYIRKESYKHSFISIFDGVKNISIVIAGDDLNINGIYNNYKSILDFIKIKYGK